MSANVLRKMAAAALEIWTLPLVLERLPLCQHRIQPEVHRSHVERAHLGTTGQGTRHAVVHRHVLPTTRRDVDDDVARLANGGEELAKDGEVAGRTAIDLSLIHI